MRPTVLERAFELARTGKFNQIADIARMLSKEDYGEARAQLAGASIRKQLVVLMQEAGAPPQRDHRRADGRPPKLRDMKRGPKDA